MAAPRPRTVAPTRADASAGLAARHLAWEVVAEVLQRRLPLDETFEAQAAGAGLNARDESLARAIAVVAFRRFGTLRAALGQRLAKGAAPKDERILALLAVGAAQILFLDVPDHAAVDLAVRLARGDPRHRHQAGLVNAVLRRLARERAAIGEADPLDVDTPAWLAGRWTAAYGRETARAIARAHRDGAPLDLTIKADAAAWAERLEGTLLPTGSVRLSSKAAVRDLPGYDEGAWWVQDAAASLPARVLGPRPGERILDLCAAPGGKTAQLAAAGARVTAIDRSERRLVRVAENLARLRLDAETRVADALTLSHEPCDAVLLDAPCSATGTIRRHPDVPWTKRPGDVGRLADLQRRLLDKAAALVRPGGRLVFCTCSLEPEEGEEQIARFLADHPAFERRAVTADEVGGEEAWITAEGAIRTLTCHFADRGGLDGFFVARLVRGG